LDFLVAVLVARFGFGLLPEVFRVFFTGALAAGLAVFGGFAAARRCGLCGGIGSFIQKSSSCMREPPDFQSSIGL
jgi:hypothetical protein